MINLGLNRRSFLKGASLSVATFVCGTIVNPVASVSKAAGFLGQQKVLDGISIESGSLPAGVKLVDTMKAEKAFLLGFQRIGHKYAKLLKFIDVQPLGSGFMFSGKVGTGIDTCTIGFNTSSLIGDDFSYMNQITKDVYGGVKFYFEMPYHERVAGRTNGGWGIMDQLSKSDLYNLPRVKNA
jgi:hypothetical protein